MAPPPSIQGPTGRRIRVVLGSDGNSWLLILSHDDGNRKWQTQNWKSIPTGLGKQINNCLAKNRIIKQVDFGPANEWVVQGIKKDGSGSHAWWGGIQTIQSNALSETVPRNEAKVSLGDRHGLTSLCTIVGRNAFQYSNIDEGLVKRMKQANSKGNCIQFVRLFHGDQYCIKDDEGIQCKLNQSGDLVQNLRQSANVQDVAVAGDKSWIILREDSFIVSNGVDNALTNQIRDFYSNQKERTQKRDREIKEYHDRERAEQEAREAAERERREAEERAAREEEEERRRAEEERMRREEEERAKKAAESLRATALEVKLVEKLTQEKESIDKMHTTLEVMEDNLSTMKEHLCARKRSLRESLDTLPSAQRPKWNLEEDSKPSPGHQKSQCVVCQYKDPIRAVVPCGHVCLCDVCASSISEGPSWNRLCPICRGPMQNTLKIYL